MGGTFAAYNALATPVLVAIDATGRVSAAGPGIDRNDVRTFVQACLLPPPDREQLEITSRAPGTDRRAETNEAVAASHQMN